jgi:1-deoxy-D-xylulose-5-phosphate synthase
MTPADENELRQMLSTAFQLKGPAAVRYPRGTGTGTAIDPELNTLAVGKAEMRRTGRGIAILAFGTLLDTALTVGDELNATVVNMRFVKPLDQDLVLELARTHELLVTVEENALPGGAGSAVLECLAAARLPAACLNLGLPDRFIEHGERNELLAECGLDADGMRRAILRVAPQRLAPRAETG